MVFLCPFSERNEQCLALVLVASILLCGCSEADKANANISKQADYFESERKITVYNARTDKIIMEAEGYMSISNNSSNELVCTVKVGPDSYRKNYIYLKFSPRKFCSIFHSIDFNCLTINCDCVSLIIS